MSPTELEERVALLAKEVEELKLALADLFEPADPLEAAFDRFRAVVEAKRKSSSSRRRS